MFKQTWQDKIHTFWTMSTLCQTFGQNENLTLTIIYDSLLLYCIHSINTILAIVPQKLNWIS
jgi:hypothetical protein